MAAFLICLNCALRLTHFLPSLRLALLPNSKYPDSQFLFKASRRLRRRLTQISERCYSNYRFVPLCALESLWFNACKPINSVSPKIGSLDPPTTYNFSSINPSRIHSCTPHHSYHRSKALAQVNPLPKAAKHTRSPSCTLPNSQASHRAMGTLAAVVLPYF